MSYRLNIRHAGRTRNYPLTDETVLGSGTDADIHIIDPGVSRRHARFRLTGGQLSVEDLGSLNGTEVDGQRGEPGQSMPLAVGTHLQFGPVEAVVEDVPPEDLAVAIAFESPDADPDAKPNSGARQSPTVGSSELHQFLFARLPGVLRRVREQQGAASAAAVIGEATFSAMPAFGLRITSPEGGVLFTIGRLEIEGHWVKSGQETLIEAVFVDPQQAETFRPLLEVAGHLLALSEGTLPKPLAQQEVPAPPDPPTLVARVRQIYEQAGRIARGDITVLILGESGTGKELLAHYLHAASGRCGEFVALNTAALPHDLLEAELFGVEKGVATGVDARPGKLEIADGGTLFLDEIGDMPAAIQAKLLRALENGELARVGARTTRYVDVRVISASNRDLSQLRRDGLFRDDLYHRIADWPVEIPPLRERRADIPNLAAHFLSRQARKQGIRPAGLAQSAVDALIAFEWPGNVRQLEREMRRVALFLDDGQLLERSHLSTEIRHGRADQQLGTTLEAILDRAERQAVLNALELSSSDTAAAAERLGISRSTLYRRMEKHGIEAP